MKKNHQGWLLLGTGLLLLLTAAVLAIIDAISPQTGKMTLNITLLAALFVMGFILAVRGYLRLIRNKIDR